MRETLVDLEGMELFSVPSVFSLFSSPVSESVKRRFFLLFLSLQTENQFSQLEWKSGFTKVTATAVYQWPFLSLLVCAHLTQDKNLRI